jgi:hypothetical protein
MIGEHTSFTGCIWSDTLPLVKLFSCVSPLPPLVKLFRCLWPLLLPLLVCMSSTENLGVCKLSLTTIDVSGVTKLYLGKDHKHLNSFTSGSVPLQIQPAYTNVNVQQRHDHSLIKSKGTAQNSNTSNINRTELMTTFMWIAFTIILIKRNWLHPKYTNHE